MLLFLGEGLGEWNSKDSTIATVSEGIVTGAGAGVTELRRQVTLSTHSIVKVTRNQNECSAPCFAPTIYYIPHA